MSITTIPAPIQAVSISETINTNVKNQDEILTQLKINNQYLKHVVGEQNEVVESDIEIKE